MRNCVCLSFNSAGKSDFLNNPQCVGFADVGAAWSGSILAEDNFFNYVSANSPTTVTIDSNREPVLYDYGFGLRSACWDTGSPPIGPMG